MIHVTCGIIVKNDKILVAQRSETMPLPFKWEFPGGKIHLNETAEECIIREIKEELNLTVKIKQRLQNNQHNYADKVINLIPFIVDYIEGDLILVEHKNAIWLDKLELSNLDWAEADIPIVNQFLSL